MLKKLPITATIITLNESYHIQKVIKSIGTICDEIIVIDSLSIDNTVDLAKELNVKLYSQKYLGDGPQKNYGVKFAKNDWIFSIDADERLDADAWNFLQNIDLENTNYDAFSFKRKTFIGNRMQKIWYPDRVIRLYHKKKCWYDSNKIHSSVVCKNLKKTNHHLLHYSYKDFAHLAQKTHFFITLGADKLTKDVKIWEPFLHAISDFFKKMILKRGIFQGFDSWVIAITSFYCVFMKYALQREKQKKENNLNGRLKSQNQK